METTKTGELNITIDGKLFCVPEQITVKEALAQTSHQNAMVPEKPELSTACHIGACFSCAVEIDGAVKLACNTLVKEKMNINTKLPEEYVPMRKVKFFSGPAGIPQVEAVCFTVGCNFVCPQCVNAFITYDTHAEALTPQEAAQKMTIMKEMIRVNRTLITGGECTLNRPWLIQYIRELRKLSSDHKARYLVDTNGSLLTHTYIDELAAVGVTDISIDLKGVEVSTFKKITGVEDEQLATNYKEVAWEAVRYLTHTFAGKISLSVSIPFNKDFISSDELNLMGKRLFKIDPSLHIGVISYSGAFKKKDMIPPRYEEMKKAHSILEGVGLRNVFAKTTEGFIRPSGTFLRTKGPY